jgi:hypothetical protein
MDSEQIRSRLKAMPTGTKVKLKLEDGAEVEGRFNGVGEDDQVHIAGNDDVGVDRVETVLMDVSSGAGPE